MSVKELEQAVARLSPDELAQFTEWFDSWREREWDAWDRQIESDVAAGKLDRLIRQAENDVRSGRTKPL